jgi:hypothetical protein
MANRLTRDTVAEEPRTARRLEGWATTVLYPTLRDAALVYPEALEGGRSSG